MKVFITSQVGTSRGYCVAITSSIFWVLQLYVNKGDRSHSCNHSVDEPVAKRAYFHFRPICFDVTDLLQSYWWLPLRLLLQHSRLTTLVAAAKPSWNFQNWVLTRSFYLVGRGFSLDLVSSILHTGRTMHVFCAKRAQRRKVFGCSKVFGFQGKCWFFCAVKQFILTQNIQNNLLKNPPHYNLLTNSHLLEWRPNLEKNTCITIILKNRVFSR